MEKIIFTKKIPKNFKEKLEFLVFDYDFLEISFNSLDKKILEKKENIFIFTSSNAILAIKKFDLKNLKCYCISGKTSLLAEKNGFKILAKAKNSFKLAEKILEKKEKKLIHLTTKDNRKELKEILKKNNISLEEIYVYEKKLSPKKINFFYNAIVFFSPSQIKSFLKLNKLEKNTIIFCIGETTANFLKEKNIKNKIITAKNPLLENLKKEIFNYYK